MKYTFPALYGQECILLPVDKALIPLVSGVLSKFLTRYVWSSDADWQQGHSAFAELLSNMQNGCVRELVESNERLYRLMSAALYGVDYIETDGVITPLIPAVPPTATGSPKALVANAARTRQLLETLVSGAQWPAGAGVQGTEPIGFPQSLQERLHTVQGDIGGFLGFFDHPATLADLLQAGRVNTDTDQGVINDGVQEIVSTVAGGGSIAEAVATFLGAGAELATDGGALAVQVAVAATQAALMGAQAAQLDELIAAVRGGLYGVVGGETPEEEVTYGLVKYLVTRLGGAGVTSPLFLLNKIANEIGPIVNDLTANQQLDAIRQAASAGGGSIDLTPVIDALATLKAAVDCVCEAVGGGTGGGDGYPGPDGLACEDYPNLALIGYADFDGTGIGTFTEFTLQPDATGVFPVTLPSAGGGLGVSGVRNLCVVVVFPTGTDPVPVVSGTFTPLKVSDGSAGARPSLSYDANPADVVGAFEANSSDDASPIGYLCSFSAGAGEATGLRAKVYVFSGALG